MLQFQQYKLHYITLQILIRFIMQEKKEEGKTPSSLWYFEEMKFACVFPLSVLDNLSILTNTPIVNFTPAK